MNETFYIEIVDTDFDPDGWNMMSVHLSYMTQKDFLDNHLSRMNQIKASFSRNHFVLTFLNPNWVFDNTVLH
jgi:hypothetical protein